MCRSIKVLRTPESVATPDEVAAAALQFVRKVSGSRKPSKINQAAFDAAVKNVATATEKLLQEMTVRPAAKTRPAAHLDQNAGANTPE